jgi:ACDE family multidrug resistance protein
VIAALIIWATLGKLGSVANNGQVIDLITRVKNAKSLLKNKVILTLVLVIFLRNSGFNSLMVWVPLYLAGDYQESLGYSPSLYGFYFSLLTLFGAISAPVLGWLSDKYSRKIVLVPSLLIASVLVGTIPIIGADSKLLLGIVFALTGLFTYSLGQLLQAAVLDQIGTGSEGATMGLVLGANSIISAVSPLIAGRLIVANFGISNVFYYNMSLWLASAVLLLWVKLKNPNQS